MSKPSQDELIRQLSEQLDQEKERADRLEIESIIAWECLATMREIFVKHRFDITMHKSYESIRAVEGGNLYDEIDRRLEEKRERERRFSLPPHSPPETLKETTIMDEDETSSKENI